MLVELPLVGVIGIRGTLVELNVESRLPNSELVSVWVVDDGGYVVVVAFAETKSAKLRSSLREAGSCVLSVVKMSSSWGTVD